MTPAPEPRETADASRKPWVLLFVAVCLVSINLRMTIMGVGPLLEQIADDQGVSASSLGLLASVPLIAWGLVSPLAHSLSTRIGLSNTVTWSLVLLMIGTVWRSFPGGPFNLWFGTALIGAALAIGNVLMPVVVRRDFSNRLSLVMGAYTAVLGGSASVAAGIVVPLSQLEHGGEPLGWRFALLATGFAVPPALAVWIWATRRWKRPQAPSSAASIPSDPAAPAADRATGVGRAIWRDPLAWGIAGYMGAQSAMFYIVATWLAPISTSFGRSPLVAGFDVMIFQIFGVVGSLCFPLLFRGRLRTTLPMLLPAVLMAASAGIVLAPGLMPLWCVVAGLVCGSTLSLALMYTALRARDQSTATALSGMSQSFGYLISALGPIGFGVLHELSGDWLLSLALLLGIGVAQILIGLRIRHDRYVLDS